MVSGSWRKHYQSRWEKFIKVYVNTLNCICYSFYLGKCLKVWYPVAIFLANHIVILALLSFSCKYLYPSLISPPFSHFSLLNLSYPAIPLYPPPISSAFMSLYFPKMILSPIFLIRLFKINSKRVISFLGLETQLMTQFQ